MKGGFSLEAIAASSAPAYDYANMLDNYYKTTYTAEQASAVATLMKHCGYSVQMAYSLQGSGAIAVNAGPAFCNYFGYDENTVTYVTRRTHSLAEWCAIIDHELVNNRPIFYNGFTLSISGHAFVCDGADGNGFYHINWGWSGYFNGYFDITLLNCDEPETTTGNDGFN